MVVRLHWYAERLWPQIDAAYPTLNPPLLKQKPHRFLNFVYAWCVERFTKQEDLDEWKTELVDMLPWQDSMSLAAEEMESDSFMSMMNKQR